MPANVLYCSTGTFLQTKISENTPPNRFCISEAWLAGFAVKGQGLFPQATFSRIGSTLENVTPEEEAKWVHENISMR
jgi:hypothetical protein